MSRAAQSAQRTVAAYCSPRRRATRALSAKRAAALFPLYYDEEQTASAVEHVAQVDRTLIEDGTYFVFETGQELIACGGWSRRDKVYTGSGDAIGDKRLLEPSAEPARVRAMFVRSDWTRRGLGRRILEECEAAVSREGFRRLTLGRDAARRALYRAFGFRAVGESDVTMPDGVKLGCVWMDKAIDGQTAAGG